MNMNQLNIWKRTDITGGALNKQCRIIEKHKSGVRLEQVHIGSHKIYKAKYRCL